MKTKQHEYLSIYPKNNKNVKTHIFIFFYYTQSSVLKLLTFYK